LLRNAVQELVSPAPKRNSRARGVDTSNAANFASFDELFLSHYEVIVRLLARMLGDYGHAEELANEAFVKLYRRPDILMRHL
jgi:DNA-directed RNA polymerase specialized sigma24 family protein